MADPNPPLRQILEELGEASVRLKNAQYEWGGPGTNGYATASEWLREKDKARADARDSRARLNTIIAVIAAIFAAIAAWPVIREWILPSPIAGNAATVQPQQSQSTEPLSTKAKTSASSDHPSEPPPGR
jgi:hypothetical protein